MLNKLTFTYLLTDQKKLSVTST